MFRSPNLPEAGSYGLEGPVGFGISVRSIPSCVPTGVRILTIWSRVRRGSRSVLGKTGGRTPSGEKGSRPHSFSEDLSLTLQRLSTGRAGG